MYVCLLLHVFTYKFCIIIGHNLDFKLHLQVAPEAVYRWYSWRVCVSICTRMFVGGHRGLKMWRALKKKMQIKCLHTPHHRRLRDEAKSVSDLNQLGPSPIGEI